MDEDDEADQSHEFDDGGVAAVEIVVSIFSSFSVLLSSSPSMNLHSLLLLSRKMKKKKKKKRQLVIDA